MIVTILSEPRSGSTNLAKWFSINKDFTVLFEPFNPDMKSSKWYKFGESPTIWKYNTKHLLIKEIYDKNHPQLNELMGISDKIIILYREDIETQTESWINAYNTKNWDNPWVYIEPKKLSEDIMKYFYDIKHSLKENFIEAKQHFTISYEELYYNNGLQRVVDYLNIDGVENVGFPYGQKYRINIDKPRSLI
jgi:hypothetical protein